MTYRSNIIGAPTVPSAIDITLKSNGWSWIGYPAQASNSIDAAFASANPQEGDIVKSQSAFSIYTDGGWVGTLTAMVPGDGYLYNSLATVDKTFRFPKPAVSSSRFTVSRRSSRHSGNFRDNMTMVAVVMDGDELVENAVVSVYANGELCGFSGEAMSDSKHFLTIERRIKRGCIA